VVVRDPCVSQAYTLALCRKPVHCTARSTRVAATFKLALTKELMARLLSRRC